MMAGNLAIGAILLRLGVALIAGAVLGWEREAKDKPAGLRTHVLVALGSAGFALLAAELIEGFRANQDALRIDPLRIIHGVATGVGFLGAGAIMRSGGEVRGLTTAASIWVASAAGVAIGFGYFALATGLVVFALLALVGLRAFEHHIGPKEPVDDADAED